MEETAPGFSLGFGFGVARREVHPMRYHRKPLHPPRGSQKQKLWCFILGRCLRARQVFGRARQVRATLQTVPRQNPRNARGSVPTPPAGKARHNQRVSDRVSVRALPCGTSGIQPPAEKGVPSKRPSESRDNGRMESGVPVPAVRRSQPQVPCKPPERGCHAKQRKGVINLQLGRQKPTLTSPYFLRCPACSWHRDVHNKGEARYFAASHTKKGISCKVWVVKRWRAGHTEIVDLIERCTVSRHKR